MPSTTPAAERPSPTSPEPEQARPPQEAVLPQQQERAIQPEVTESGLRWPVLVKSGSGQLRVERISGSEYRYVPVKDQPGKEQPEVKVGDRWVQVKGAFEKDVQELFLPVWSEADDLGRGELIATAEQLHAVVEATEKAAAKERRDRDRMTANLRERIAALKDPKKLKVRAKSAIKKKLYADEAAATAALEAERAMLEDKLSGLVALEQPKPAEQLAEQSETTEEENEAFEIDGLDLIEEEALEGSLDEVVEPHAVDQALTPTAPIPELQKTVVARYGEFAKVAGEESFGDWMVKTLKENSTSQAEQLQKEAVAGVAPETVERETADGLATSYAMIKFEQDRQTAAINQDAKYDALRETLDELDVSYELLPDESKSKKFSRKYEGVIIDVPVGETFAKEVAAVADKERTTASKRRFLPAFVRERISSALNVRSFRALWKGEVGEFGEAQHFRRETDQAAREFLESLQDRALFGAGTEGNVVDSAVSQMRERLGKLRAFSGEGMDERIAAREAELRGLLKKELGTANGLLEDRDVEALADKLRGTLDKKYWWRYVTGAAELAVAGAVGGYFLAAKGASAAGVEFGPRVAKATAKKAARAALQAIARSHMPAFELPGIETSVPREIRDSVNMRGSIWATVRRAANEAGLNPTNSELGQMVIKVCKENNIAVKAWGLSGRLKDTELPDGLLLRGVRSAIGRVAASM